MKTARKFAALSTNAPLDARQGFQDKTRNRHQCASITGTDTGVSLATLDQIGGNTHRRVFFIFQRQCRRIIHRYYFGRGVHAQARPRLCVAHAQLGSNGIRQANQDQIDIRIILKKLERSGNGDMAAMIPPHYVDCYGYVHSLDHMMVVGNCGSLSSKMATKKP